MRLLCYLFTLEKVVDAIDVTTLESRHELFKSYVVLDYVAEHELYGATHLDLLLYLSIVLFESALTLAHFALNPGGKVNSIDKRLLVIVVLLKRLDQAHYIRLCVKLILVESSYLEQGCRSLSVL